MSQIRALMARLYAVVFSVQLSMMSLRERAIRSLLTLITVLLPGIAFAEGDVADMIDSGAAGARRVKSSGMDYFQMIGLFVAGASLLALKKVGSHPQITLGRCLAGIGIGALMFVIPELIGRVQKQAGMSSVTIS